MNRTRLQIPLTPPEPHFDDESTIVSARRVVPIGRAPFSQRWRNVRAFVALLLLATVCGALGAAVVNHFEKRQGFSAAPIGPALQTDESQKPSTSSSPQVLITSDSRTVGATIPQEQSPESEAPTNTQVRPARVWKTRLQRALRTIISKATLSSNLVTSRESAESRRSMEAAIE